MGVQGRRKYSPADLSGIVISWAFKTPATNVSISSELNACWNSVVRKLFGYHKWESVSAVLLGL